MLIQSMPPHRRARSPAWSYNFYPDETWVELTLTLPCAVLLKEIHLKPHLASLATCPSGVGIEISRDGKSALVPIGPPMETTGLTFIRMVLPQPEVVTTVLLRLYKPRDWSNIGLSQIRLLGTTTFGEANSSNEDVIQSSFSWLRLLHHSISVASDCNSDLKNRIISSAALTDGLLEACCGLILVPAPAYSIPCLEKILLAIGLFDSQLGLKVIDILLKNGASPFHQGLLNSVNSVMDLLYSLCCTQDDASELRVNSLLSWLQNTAASQPSSMYIHCIAAILWTLHESESNIDLENIITDDLFSTLYTWTLNLQSQSILKKAIDTVLCSICYIKPMMFQTLLQKTGVLVPIKATGPAASISDDRKDPETTSKTDDSKELELGESSEWYDRLVLQDLESLVISEGQLMTIAMACQSPPAVVQLLDSGLPSLLTQAIIELCTKKGNRKKKSTNQSMTDSDKASNHNHNISSSQEKKSLLHVKTLPVILQFLTELSFNGLLRDWLGSNEGSVFWLPLLKFLCCRQTKSQKYQLISDSLALLESAAVKFFSRCCSCHQSQKRLASVLCEVISEQKNSSW
uniref:Uncharacterized protein n=3 Tax=Clastoptera arizonana TaxID=38151 RepID=A0A1B6DSS9_9HEMI